MLPKDKRLNLKKDFTWVVSANKRVETPIFKLFFRFGDNQNPRVGISLSKANFKKAAERNRAKRLVSAGLQVLYKQILQSANIIVIPQSWILGLSSAEIQSRLEEVLKKSKLLQDEG